MGLSHSRFKFPQVGLTILIAFILLAGNLALALHAALDIWPSPLSSPLFAIAIASVLTLWVHYDSRLTKASTGLDQALYVLVGWPIIFPIYIFRAYGFRSGSLILLSFFGIYVLTWIPAIVLILIVSIEKVILSAG